MKEPQPVYAEGFFHLRRTGLVDQVVVFDYYDPDRYYYRVLRHKLRLKQEKENLMNNMQYYLDMERVLINGKDANPRVIHVDIGLRGKPENPYIVFLIEFKGELVRGLNTYENIYEEEVAEYPYTVYWIFPEDSAPVEAEVGVPYRIAGRILYFHVPRGTHVGGYEKIVFEIL